jgi:peptidoglycan/xylan/chitin deacetylase (PgdA/CDA1 family)
VLERFNERDGDQLDDAGDRPGDEPATRSIDPIETEPTTSAAEPTVDLGSGPGAPDDRSAAEEPTQLLGGPAQDEPSAPSPDDDIDLALDAQTRDGTGENTTQVVSARSSDGDPTVTLGAELPGHADEQITQVVSDSGAPAGAGRTPGDEQTAGSEEPTRPIFPVESDRRAGSASVPPRPDGPGVAATAAGLIDRLGARVPGRIKDGVRDGLAEATSTVTRRRLLVGGVAALGLGVVGAVVGSDHKSKPHTPRATTQARPRHPTEAGVVAGHRSLPTQRKPIFTLSDYRRITKGPAFPSDAVALTIDDGPHPVWTPKILRLLDKYHVPAMFCMIGNQVLGHEAVAKSVVKAGHQIANHTWSHPIKLPGNSSAQVHKEILRAQEKIHDATGYTPKLFRSPGGGWSPTVFREAARADLIPLDWSDDPRDWARPGTAAIRKRLLAARPGQILLCHDGGGDRSETYAALSTVLPALTARGYRFVAL